MAGMDLRVIYLGVMTSCKTELRYGLYEPRNAIFTHP